MMASQICRLCCAKSTSGVQFIDIFGENSMKLSLKIYTAVHITVAENDGLTNFICFLCLGKLDYICNYVDVCVKSQQWLREQTGQQSWDVKADSANGIDDDHIDRKASSINSLLIEEEVCKKSIDEKTGESVIATGIPFIDDCHPPNAGHDCQDENRSDNEEQMNDRAVEALMRNRRRAIESRAVIESTEKSSRSKADTGISCCFCDVSFSNVSELKTHLNPTKKGSCHYCLYCTIRFPSYCSVSQHALTAHKREAVYMCEICNKKFNELGDCEYHKFRRHTEKQMKRLRCDACTKLFPNSVSLIVHRRNHSNDSSLICPDAQCGKTASSFVKLEHHARNEHNDVFTCVVCKKSMESVDSYFGHMCRHRNILPYRCPECKKVCYSRMDMRDHYLVLHADITNKFPCQDCKQEFPSESSLIRHQKSSHSVRTYINRYISSHVSTGKITEEVFKCTICSKTFNKDFVLQSHMLIRHSDAKPSYCNVCKQHCNDASHKTSEFTEKPIRDAVKKSSDMWKELKEGKRRDSKEHSKESYACEVCDKTFIHKSSLDEHKRSHQVTKVSCDLCNKRFNCKYKMEAHKLRCTAKSGH